MNSQIKEEQSRSRKNTCRISKAKEIEIYHMQIKLSINGINTV